MTFHSLPTQRLRCELRFVVSVARLWRERLSDPNSRPLGLHRVSINGRGTGKHKPPHPESTGGVQQKLCALHIYAEEILPRMSLNMRHMKPSHMNNCIHF